MSIVARFLAFFAAGLFVGIIAGKFLLAPDPLAIEESVKREIDLKFREKVQEALLPIPEVPIEPTSFSGEVIAIEGNKLTIEVANFYRGGSFVSYLYQPNYFTKEILVTEKTKILKLQLNETFELEEVEALLAELEIGMFVDVELFEAAPLEAKGPFEAKVVRFSVLLEVAQPQLTPEIS